MSKRSYTACYLHLIWNVKDKIPLLKSKEAGKAMNAFINEYSQSKDIRVVKSYINPDHVHLLIEFATNQTIEDIVKLIKGSSSHWINQNDIIKSKFAWGVGYGAFTVSKSNLNKVYKYIANQEVHHKKVTFLEEYEAFIKKHGLKTDKSV